MHKGQYTDDQEQVVHLEQEFRGDRKRNEDVERNEDVRNIQRGPRISSKGEAHIHNGSLFKTDRENIIAFANYLK